MTNAIKETAREPIHGFVNQFWDEEQQETHLQQEKLQQLAEAIDSLNAWSERLEQWQEEAIRHEQELEASQHATEQIKVEYEQECTLLRQRVSDLEISLQDRTEELLRAQAANNALAALQSASIHKTPDGSQPDEHPSPNHEGQNYEAPNNENDQVTENQTEGFAPHMNDGPPPEGPEVATTGQSVAERFEMLRRGRTD